MSLLGHKSIVRDLQRRIAQGSLHQALLFFGPSGVGKKKLAFQLLQGHLCPRLCGDCSSCRAVVDRQSDLVHQIQWEEKKNISVAQVREIHRFFDLKSQWPLRFVIIDEAHRLSQAAANALLKVLEEPPDGSHFFLLTDRIHALPATIRSRCQKFRFSSLSDSDLKAVPGVSPDILPWAQGRADVALYLSQDEGREHLKASHDLLEALVLGQFLDWKNQAPQFFKKGRWAETTFDFWLRFIQLKLRGESVPGDGFLKLSDEELLAIGQTIQKARKDWARFVDKGLILENLSYEVLRHLKQKGASLWKSPTLT